MSTQLRSRDVEHLTAEQRCRIRKDTRTDLTLARHWGVKVETIRKIRHRRHIHVGLGGGGGGGRSGSYARVTTTFGPAVGTVTRMQGEPKPVAPPGALPLHVEGGPDLPQPIR